MAIHVALKHVTHYRYDRAVNHGPHVVRLRPAPHSRTRVLSYSQKIEGGEHFINWHQDPFSNWNARLVFLQPMKELSITIDLVVEMAVLNPFDFFLEDEAEHYPFDYEPDLKHDLAPFLKPGEATPLLLALVESVRPAKGAKPRTIDQLVTVNQAVHKAVGYTIRLEPGVQEPEETLEKATGSCRDSAWLLTQVLRRLGLAARFVSGYLIQLTADVKSLDGPSGPEKDFTDLHAWCEVYLPGAGWVGLDPTSGLLAGEGHIPLSCTPEPKSAAPVTGGVDECEATLEHTMAVTRVLETPRVTLPYSEEEWSKIEVLGRTIDGRLKRGDVRLTMGGEPTFVSVDDPDGPEWNFTAVSVKKRQLAGRLMRRLAGRYAPGALLHYGQGKWYPGEQLPRWALSAYWRPDGVPVWHDPALFADEEKEGRLGEAQARELIQGIAQELGVDGQYILPGYEDVFYYTWKERRLPVNVTPEDSRLNDPFERERLAKVFREGLGSVVGYTLPLEGPSASGSAGWRSGSWFLREGEKLWLIPGDSAMGLRLPLDSVPWVAKSEYPYLYPRDPMDPRLPPLPRHFLRQAQLLKGRPEVSAKSARGVERPQEKPDKAPVVGQSAPWVIRTALCVQPRDGRLHVFMPPVATTEDYLELVSAVEAAAEHTGYPVVVEGDAPPRDYRISKFSVTPDPGVIEVNLHPSHSWDELVERTTVLYEEAHQTRLGTEKFMIDGRHAGTGGGNHILLGGATPADSPLLRRPDLLRSLVSFWQNHPSLSRLFSGLFIGPTSQAPRLDEARHDALHELELAFSELDRQQARFGHTPPWLVDRLFRNLLVDSTGNTHRAEFSIDKMFSPDSASGRLGLLEMRAFEMPPHARMSLAQHLLLRGLVSTFWDNPYRRDLVRWGTDIHDRWLLPHFCEQDFHEVLDHLREAGLPFQNAWFDPHHEFRFPKIGDFAARGIEVELRGALEPWHVLGEEPAGGGTVRNVDSSLERVQVLARGLIGDRYALACNGRRVPLHPTGTNGEAVAGVRYRAWQPPECLQPTIGVHAPLVFDLIDTWNERSLGGCSYHVSHPGGMSFEAFPVNSYEAEGRRLARFFRHGHTAGRVDINRPPVDPEHPFTLDLRTS
jgi:uncharacterized protein (DUF2126 family)/transglutaminase-like putative cysteine protease